MFFFPFFFLIINLIRSVSGLKSKSFGLSLVLMFGRVLKLHGFLTLHWVWSFDVWGCCLHRVNHILKFITTKSMLLLSHTHTHIHIQHLSTSFCYLEVSLGLNDSSTLCSRTDVSIFNSNLTAFMGLGTIYLRLAVPIEVLKRNENGFLTPLL